MKIQESSSLNKLSFVVFFFWVLQVCLLFMTRLISLLIQMGVLWWTMKSDKFVESNGCSLVNYENTKIKFTISI